MRCLVPTFWKKTMKDVSAASQARCETIETAPIFKQAYRAVVRHTIIDVRAHDRADDDY